MNHSRFAELRFAARSLARTPGFSLAVVATFALGIGANVAVFSAAWSAWLAPLPYEAPQRLVAVWQTTPEIPQRAFSPANFLDLRREAKSLASAASYFLPTSILTGAGEPQRVEVAQVSASFFTTLGVEPRLGRCFAPGDSGPLAVVSEGFWREELAAAPLDGLTIELDGKSWEVVAVAPASLAFPAQARIWTLAPLDVAPLPLPIAVDLATLRDAQYLGVVARLAPGHTLDEADAELRELARRLRESFPEENNGLGLVVRSLADDLGEPVRRPLALLAGAAACVLLVTCVNVAGLLLARGLSRRREVAVARALGAGWRRLVARPLWEAVLLAGAGTTIGLGLAQWAAPRLIGSLPDADPAGRGLGIGAAVVLFAAGSGLVAALAAAAAPTLAALRVAPIDTLGSARGAAGGPRSRLRTTLVVAQVALAVVLVAGALLLTRTLSKLLAVDVGFRSERVLTAGLLLPAADGADPSVRRESLERAVAAAAAAPGVESAGGVQRLPLTGAGISAGLEREGDPFEPRHEPDARWRTVSGDYFRTLGIRLRAGRLFGPQDRAGAEPVAIVNEALARRLWPGQDAIGRRCRTGLDGEDLWVTVVGVVADTPATKITERPGPELYRPLAQPNLYGSERLVLAVRTGPGFSVEALRRALREAAPALVIEPERRLTDLIADATHRERVLGRLLTAFGGLALVLAALGLHGLLTLIVTERTRELGVRLAIGAAASDLVTGVLRRAAGHTLAGAALGLLAAFALARGLREWLWGIAPHDPLSLGGAVLALGAVCALAATLPALRVARIDPAAVLRQE